MRPYEFIGTPAITLLLYAIARHCAVGGCITPGVRALARWAGVSPGLVSPCLHQLARDGWIAYDGRVIMLLIDPDQSADQIDQPTDRSETISGLISAENPITVRNSTNDQRADRFEAPMVDSCLATTGSRHDSVAVSYRLPCATPNDQPSDRIDHGAAALLAELGAGRGVIPKALAARDWTAEQIRARWEYDQERIRNSDGRLTEGVFWAALMAGQLAPVRRDTAVDWAQLAAEQQPADGVSLRDYALSLAPPGLSGRDFQLLLRLLAEGKSDEAALAELASRRSAVRR